MKRLWLALLILWVALAVLFTAYIISQPTPRVYQEPGLTFHLTKDQACVQSLDYQDCVKR